MDFFFSQNPDDTYTLCRYVGTETHVEIPEMYCENPVTSIGDFAFCEHELTSVTIPYSVKSIGKFAFNSSGLMSVTIPDSVTSIGDFAFRGTHLISVMIPDSVISIGDFAFEGTGLKTIILPSSVKVGVGAFEGTYISLSETYCE